MSRRAKYTQEQKMKILREYLKDRVPISQLAQKYDLHPNVIYSWEKQLFEAGDKVFGSKSQSSAPNIQSTKRITELEETVKKRDEAIDFLLQETIKAKKNSRGVL